jgi:hypothetical protein
VAAGGIKKRDWQVQEVKMCKYCLAIYMKGMNDRRNLQVKMCEYCLAIYMKGMNDRSNSQLVLCLLISRQFGTNDESLIDELINELKKAIILIEIPTSKRICDKN